MSVVQKLYEHCSIGKRRSSGQAGLLWTKLCPLPLWGVLMNAVLVALLALNLLVLGVVLWRLAVLSRLNALLDTELKVLRQVPQDQSLDLDELLGRGKRTVIVMDILNPMEVAASQSWFADRFGSVAAPLIRRIVYDQAVKNIHREVAKWGVQAQVTLHRGA